MFFNQNLAYGQYWFHAILFACMSIHCYSYIVNTEKTMLRSISFAKSVTKEAGFSNPIYEGNKHYTRIHNIRIKYQVKHVLLFHAVDNGMGVLKNSSSVKPLREVTGIINPIYASKNTSIIQEPT